MKKEEQARLNQDKKSSKKLTPHQIRQIYFDKESVRNFEAHLEEFSICLKHLGLFIRDVAADGNCLFRSISDQLEGYPENYDYYRQKTASYIEKNKKTFVKYLDEDEDPFDDYVNNLREDNV